MEDVPKISFSKEGTAVRMVEKPKEESGGAKVIEKKGEDAFGDKKVKLSQSNTVLSLKLKNRRRWWGRLLVLAMVVLGLVLLAGWPAWQLVRGGKEAYAKVQTVVEAVKRQDLPEAKTALAEAEREVVTLQKTYRLLGWLRFTPITAYYQDGEHALAAAVESVQAGRILVTAVEPHVDVLGLKGEGTFTGGTTEDRIVAILGTLNEIRPSVAEAAEKLTMAQEEIRAIKPERYRLTVKGKELESLILRVKGTMDEVVTVVTRIQPVLEVLPIMAGVEEQQRYLVLFQNDAELRPTGGFMTAYAIMTVDRGRIIAERSVDIYELDAKFRKRLEPPEPIKKYLEVNSWYLRDMNFSPDFAESMKMFLSYYRELPGEAEIDGVIAIDTKVLKDLVAILGPLEVSEFGTFSMETDERCNCPQVIYKLEDLVTRPVATIRSDRKAVLGPMMQTIIQKAYDAESNAWPALFQSFYKNVTEKHIIFYMIDNKVQGAVEGFNAGGRITGGDGDYFLINDANFGGAKSNLFITQEVEQEISLEGDKVKKMVTILYKNPFAGSNCNLEAGKLCLNGVLQDFFRLYVPKGSKLIESSGFEEDSVTTYEELEKTAIEGFFTLTPQSQTKLELTYTVPYRPEGTYLMTIQKQPGTYSPKYTIILGAERQEFELTVDKDWRVALP